MIWIVALSSKYYRAALTFPSLSASFQDLTTVSASGVWLHDVRDNSSTNIKIVNMDLCIFIFSSELSHHTRGTSRKRTSFMYSTYPGNIPRSVLSSTKIRATTGPKARGSTNTPAELSSHNGRPRRKRRYPRYRGCRRQLGKGYDRKQRQQPEDYEELDCTRPMPGACENKKDHGKKPVWASERMMPRIINIVRASLSRPIPESPPVLSGARAARQGSSGDSPALHKGHGNASQACVYRLTAPLHRLSPWWRRTPTARPGAG